MVTKEDWKLQCCTDNQFFSICLIIGYSILILKLWRVPILHPFKILTVFLHELGHATAVWLTCGRVTGMEVHPDEGGVTKHIGGIAFIVLPAGYLGSAVWGMGFVIASASILGSEIAAGILLLFLFIFIFYANNSYLRILNLLFFIILSSLLGLNIWTNIKILHYITLFMGVMSCLFSIYDIWDDLISRRVNESDASKFAEITHTSSRCWGIIWGLIAIGTLIGAIYFHLLILDNGDKIITKLNQLSITSKIGFIFVCIVLVLGILHTIITRRCMVRLHCCEKNKNKNNDHYIAA